MDSNTETYTKTFSIDIERENYHRKCRNRRRKRFLIVMVIWVFVFIYLFTPLSKVNLKVNGNVYYTKEELMKMSYINKSEYWWLVNTKKARKVLNSYDYIENVTFKKSFLGVTLEIDEVYPIGIKNEKYVMSNKQMIEKNNYDLNHKISNLTSFDSINEHDLSLIVNEYKDIKLSVREHFNKLEIIKSEIAPDEYYNYVKLYGEDSRIGSFIIKVDLVYLDTKFNGNKYNKIIEEVEKNKVKYGSDNPALIAYHDLDEDKFYLVDAFKEE